MHPGAQHESTIFEEAGKLLNSRIPTLACLLFFFSAVMAFMGFSLESCDIISQSFIEATVVKRPGKHSTDQDIAGVCMRKKCKICIYPVLVFLSSVPVVLLLIHVGLGFQWIFKNIL